MPVLRTTRSSRTRLRVVGADVLVGIPVLSEETFYSLWGIFFYRGEHVCLLSLLFYGLKGPDLGGGGWGGGMYLRLFFFFFVPALFPFSCESSILDYNNEQGKPRWIFKVNYCGE